MNKELIKLRVGNKAFERLTSNNEFIYPKSKIPKGYNSEVTKQVLILCPEKNELFELVEIDMNFTDKLCYVRIKPFDVENSDIKSTVSVVNISSKNKTILVPYSLYINHCNNTKG